MSISDKQTRAIDSENAYINKTLPRLKMPHRRTMTRLKHWVGEYEKLAQSASDSGGGGGVNVWWKYWAITQMLGVIAYSLTM